MDRVTRRDFLKGAAGAGAAAAFGGLAAAGGGRRTAEAPPPQVEERANSPLAYPSDRKVAYLAVTHGIDTALVTKAAIDALGGMERFVKKGDQVIVKPNICTDANGPEYASTTNPTVVATLVTLCLEAGAARVRVMDNPFGGPPESAYEVSGIKQAVNAVGGDMEIMSQAKYARFQIPQGRDLGSWTFYRDVLEADVLINVPIGKDHGLTRLTLGGKNIMGVILDPGQIHQNIAQRVADLVSLVRPTLTVVDAVRILTSGGPTGGDLSAVKKLDTVIASTDIVAADSYATGLFGLTPHDVGYIPAMAAMGLGRMTVKKSEIEELTL